MRRHNKHGQHRECAKVKEKAKVNNKMHALPWRCQCGYDNAVSWWLPFCVTVATMAVRINYVMSPRSWWILHPDEIYQSVEVAFSQVYGYGFRPYEYLPAPGASQSNPYMNHTLNTGMYALRSFIYPNMFTLVLRLFKALGMDSNPFMICRIFNAIVTSTLPMSVFYLTMKVFSCRLFGFLACVLSASSLQTTVYGTHAVINSFIAPFLFFGLGLCFENDTIIISFLHKNKNQKPITRTEFSDHNENIVKPTNINGTIAADHAGSCIESEQSSQTGFSVWPFVGGIIIGIISYVRSDTLLFFTIVFPALWIASIVRMRSNKVSVTCITTGSVVAILICALDDMYHYGFGTLSAIQWFKFNIMSGQAKLIFESPIAKSYLDVFLADRFSTGVFVMSAIILLIGLFQRQLETGRRDSAVVVSFIFLLIIYSIIGHKDARFLFNVYVLYAIILAISIHMVVLTVVRFVRDSVYMWNFIFVFMFLFPLNNYVMFPTAENAQALGWSYGKSKQSRDINMCLDQLRQLGDVTGVFVNGSVYDIGGFTILTHNVPILVKSHFEFTLYESHTDNMFGEGSQLKILNNYQDFFHQSNRLYLSKLFREDTRFNYLISRSVPPELYKRLNFNKRIGCGSFFVYHRDTTALKGKEDVSLSKFQVGDNATVLEYEGSWLFTNGLYQKAIDRLERGLELDRSRVRPFQLLMGCYEKLKLRDKALFYQNECYRQHGKQKCHTQQDKIVLQDEYRRFDHKK